MLQNRAAELAAEIARATGATGAKAKREVTLTVDRLVDYAGWTDKYQSVFGGVNPVATPHFNFTVPEPTGVVAVLAPDEPPLLALVSLVAPVILSGNTAIVIPSEKFPLPAATFAEILATSDLPGGVVNLLTGKRAELVPHIAGHLDVNAVVDAAGNAELSAKLQSGTAINLKRYANRSLRRPTGSPQKLKTRIGFSTRSNSRPLGIQSAFERFWDYQQTEWFDSIVCR